MADAAQDLELKLGNAVAEFGQRHVLEHDMAKAAKGRNIAVNVGDQRIDVLVLRAVMEAQGAARQIQRVAVGPDPAQPRRLSGAQANRKRDGIGVVGFADADG